MDGNGRWAKKRLLPRSVGHIKGAANLKEIVKACFSRGVECLTVFAFSTENWRRPPDEVAILFDLFVRYLQQEVQELKEKGVRLRIIGDRSGFPDELQKQMQLAEAATVNNSKLNLTVAVSYGGKWDIIQAVKGWQRDNPYASADELTPEALDPHLSTAGLPHPDLMIRTSGEMRVSNFLLWQISYAELYVTDVLWPDFREKEFQKALDEYARRERRFGGLGGESGGE